MRSRVILRAFIIDGIEGRRLHPMRIGGDRMDRVGGRREERDRMVACSHTFETRVDNFQHETLYINQD